MFFSFQPPRPAQNDDERHGRHHPDLHCRRRKTHQIKPHRNPHYIAGIEYLGCNLEAIYHAEGITWLIPLRSVTSAMPILSSPIPTIRSWKCLSTMKYAQSKWALRLSYTARAWFQKQNTSHEPHTRYFSFSQLAAFSHEYPVQPKLANGTESWWSTQQILQWHDR